MADSNPMSMGKVDQLVGGRNYSVWSMKVSAILRSRKLYKIAIEEDMPPECRDSSLPAYNIRKNWEEKNDEVFGIIVLTLSNDQAGMFINENNAKNLWDSLKWMYAGNCQDLIIDVNLEIKELKMSNVESVDSYITRARNLVAKLKSLGGNISEREVVFYTVRGLNSKLDHLGVVLRNQRSATLDEIHQSLREEETRLGIKGLTGFGISNHVEKAYKGRENKNRESSKDCYICKKRGHIAQNCWFRHNDQGSGGKYRKYNNSRRPTNHRGEHARMAEKKDEEYAFNVTDDDDDEVQACRSKSSEKVMWNLDSGCTSHMTYEENNLKNIEKYDSNINMAEKGRVIKATGKGDMRLCADIEGKKNIVTMKEVLLVPKLKMNLMSVKRLVDKGNEVYFNNDGAFIYSKKGNLIATAKEQDSMYIVETEIIKEERGNVMKEDKKSSKGERMEIRSNNGSALWHQRLGHVNIRYLHLMKEKNVVRGLNFKKLDDNLCDSCCQGKSIQKPFQTVLKSNSENILDLVHMDLCGPMPINSLGGNRYIFVLVDDYSRRIFVKLLKNKTETLEQFINFKKKFELETDRKLKRVRTDNGTEFVNQEFEKLFKSEGIKHERTVTYSPSSNGVAERTNRSLLEMIRTMLIDSKLPSEFWGEAVQAATYIKNRIYRERLKGQTPMEKWSGHKPTVEHCKVFGCIAYVYIHKSQRNKLNPSATKGIFVGYSKFRKAYRVYIPETGKIIEGRSIKFNENLKGSSLLGNAEEISLDDLQYINTVEEVMTRDIETPEDGVVIDLLRSENRTDNEDVRNENRERSWGRPVGNITRINEETRLRQEEEREERLIAEGVRRSERIRNKVQVNLMNEDDRKIQIPNTYREAVESREKEEWIEAIDDEIQSLEEHGVWHVVEKDDKMKVLASKWIFTIKKGTDGQKDRFKARLVIMGNRQRKGIDFEESYSPVIKLETLRLMLAIASKEKLKMKRFDVKTAYLYGELDEDIYMSIPQRVKYQEGKVLKLKKSLYGLPQSGKNWNDKLNEVLISIGFKRMKCDPCIYKKEMDGQYVIMGIYVDDGLIMGTNNSVIDKVMKEMREEFIIREESGSGKFLGMEIMEENGKFCLYQESQVDKLLEKYDLKDCNPTKTPMDVNQNLDDSEGSKEIDPKIYQELIGSLAYIAGGTRPDIMFGVNRLAQYNKKPNQIHWNAAKRIVRYLKGTKGYGLVYDMEPGTLRACSDASWSSTKDSKSHSGYCVYIGNNLINWKAKKQELVALSSCEAEVGAMCETVKDVRWADNLLQELKLNKYRSKPINLETDSQAGIDWARGKCVKQRTKHFARKYYYVRDEIEYGNLEVQYRSTQELEADMLTKPLNSGKLELCIRKTNLRDINFFK